MLATPQGDRIPHLIKASPKLVAFMKTMRPSASRLPHEAPLFMLGIPVQEDPELTDTQWRAYDKEGNLLSEGGEADGDPKAAA